MTTVAKITIFNGRIDKAERREVFLPTQISSASLLESRNSNQTKGVRDESLQFKLRIPINAVVQDGRTYISEAEYKALSDEEAVKHWTLRKGDYILVAQSETVPAVITQPELDALSRDLHADLIRIAEYADNTIRGTRATKHWRIGGV